MEKLILAFALFFNINSIAIAQTVTYSGKLLDKKTNNPIQYGHIYLKGKPYGTLSNFNGLFSLSNILKNDTIIISCLGYKPLAFSGQAELQKEVHLTPIVYNLKSTEIKSGKSSIIERGLLVSKIDKEKLAGTHHGRLRDGHNLINTGFQLATFIENKDKKVGFIQEVSFFLHKEGIAQTPFRLRLYEVDDKGVPSKDLMYQSIIITNGKNNDWVKVDMKDYQIELPENGFFIAMEWLQTNNKAFVYTSKWKKRANKAGKEKLKKQGYLNSKFVGFGQILGSYELPEQTTIWTKIYNQDWKKDISPTTPMMRCKIKIWD